MVREKREGWYRKDANREKRRIPRKMMVGERKGRMLRERKDGIGRMLSKRREE